MNLLLREFTNIKARVVSSLGGRRGRGALFSVACEQTLSGVGARKSPFSFASFFRSQQKRIKGLKVDVHHLKVLEHLHLKAAKLIHKLPSETPDSDVLDLVEWKPLGYIYKRRLASIMYQVFHNSLPDQLTALFEIRNTDNNYNL